MGLHPKNLFLNRSIIEMIIMGFDEDVNVKDRKVEHIDIVLKDNPEYHISTWLEYVHLIHNSLPELSMDELDTHVELFGQRFEYPILIDSMTGGGEDTDKINRALAELAYEYNIPISCGSQKAFLKYPELGYTYKVMREVSKDLFIIGNIGGQDLRSNPREVVDKIVSLIDADALAIHLNPLQESVQLEGDRDFRGVIDAIAEVTEYLDIPVIVKETGAGISYEVAKSLEAAGVSAVNVSGAGGTSWSAVEVLRSRRKMSEFYEVGSVYWDWGIPTAASIIEVVNSVDIPVIASGGIRTGLDIVKSIVLGADMAGLASPFLKALSKGEDSLRRYMEGLITQLKIGMLLTGSKDISSLKEAKYVLLGPLKEWVIQRGVWNG